MFVRAVYTERTDMEKARTDALYYALKEKGYPDDFCREIAYKQMNTDYTATRMLGYLYRVSNPRPEDVVDEMLAILSDRNAIIQKKNWNMHRQRSTGSTERGCNSQNMDKRKIAVNTGCVCLILLFIFGFYQLIQWDNTSRRGQEEAKKQKELDEAEAEEKAYERAKEYMENYRISLQESMQAAGIEDIRVSYEQYNQSTYSSVYNYWDDDPDYQYFYYELSYYCDSIDSIFEEATQDGNYDSFIELMERECKIKDQRPVEVDGFYKIFVGDRKYAVKINERDPEGELTISREYGVYYRLAQGEDGYELYTNRGKIYPKEDMEEDNESKNNAGSNSNSGSTNSSGSSYGHAGGYGSGSFYGNASGSGSGSTSGHSSGSDSLKKTDPYDVDDYDDPDDFAEEWAEDFGDGDYDDGYDDAYDYWEEEYDD